MTSMPQKTAHSAATQYAFLQLASWQLSPRLVKALLDRFDQDPIRVVAASDIEREETPGWMARHTQRAKDPAFRLTDKRWQWFQDTHARVIAITEEDYPPSLREIPDPPPFLFLRGTFGKADHLSIGIVGSRKASPYGRKVAAEFSRALAARGVTILSGGAAGIDTEAHRGAVTSGGRTLAVLGCGIDICYPQENQALFEQIIENGAILSEYAIGATPEQWRFPQRNRIISGMSQAILVVEAPRQSGALITARYAIEQGRHLMVIPGSIDRPMSQGSNELLRDGGATPILEPADVLHALRLLPATARKSQQTALSLDYETLAGAAPATVSDPTPLPEDLSPLARNIVLCLSQTPKHIDAIAQETQIESAQAGVELTLLELMGLVSRLPGNIYVRVS